MTLVRELVRPARSVAAEATLSEACRALEKEHVGSLVVLEDGAPVALVTDRDLALRAILDAPEGAAARVGSVSSAPLLSVRDTATLAEAARTLAEHGVRRLAVLDADGELAGVVSADDLVRRIVQDVAWLAAAVDRELAQESRPDTSAQGSLGPE